MRVLPQKVESVPRRRSLVLVQDNAPRRSHWFEVGQLTKLMLTAPGYNHDAPLWGAVFLKLVGRVESFHLEISDF